MRDAFARHGGVRGRLRGRRVLLRVRLRARRGAAAAEAHGGPRGGPDPDPRRDCTPATPRPRPTEVRRPRCAPGGADHERPRTAARWCCLRVNRALLVDAALARPRRAPAQGPHSAASACSSSATASSRRCESLYRTNLPVPATPFLGRELELREVVELLERDDIAAADADGPGRDGQDAARAAGGGRGRRAFPDGRRRVRARASARPRARRAAVAQALGVKEEPGRALADDARRLRSRASGAPAARQRRAPAARGRGRRWRDCCRRPP